MEVIGATLFSPGTTNRLLVALSSLIVNLGARHLPTGLPPRLQALTTSKGMRMLVVCALFYLSTRDAMLSVALAFVSFTVVATVLNEDSRFSIWDRPAAVAVLVPGARARARARAMPTPITREEYDRAVDTVLRFRHQVRRSPRAAPETVPARP